MYRLVHRHVYRHVYKHVMDMCTYMCINMLIDMCAEAKGLSWSKEDYEALYSILPAAWKCDEWPHIKAVIY